MSESHPIPGERDLIESLRAQISDSSRPRRKSALNLGIGDDCAILEPPRGHQILVTTDFSLETVHFRRDWHSPESVGHRCLARGLSDLAAMGAQPLAAFLSLALPPELVRSRHGQHSWHDRFFAGFLGLADKYHVPLAGGDTAQSPLTRLESEKNASSTRGPVTGWALADIVLVGSVPRNQALLRSGAKPGDRIYITGHLGGAAAELAQLKATPRRFRNRVASKIADPNPHPHLFPEPRLKIGSWLVKNHRTNAAITAAIDISDGFSTDLDHLCQESGLAATVDASSIPIHPLAQDPTLPISEKSLKLALNGGEDYELLFTASPDARIPRRIAGIPIACIGQMRRHNSRAPRVVLVDQTDGRNKERPLRPAGWEHYR